MQTFLARGRTAMWRTHIAIHQRHVARFSVGATNAANVLPLAATTLKSLVCPNNIPEKHQYIQEAHATVSQFIAVIAAATGTIIFVQKSQRKDDVRYNYAPACCESTTQNAEFTVLTLAVVKDQPGMLSDTARLLKEHNVWIKGAKISTDDSGSEAKHIYQVQDKNTGLGLSVERCEDLEKAFKKIGVEGFSFHDWPSYTQAEVAKHTTKETGIWVTYKGGVYDITNFIVNHPGGQDKIMLAAGKAIEPFWRIYQQHEGRENATKMLSKLAIGKLADPPPVVLGDDPYDQDPDRHPGMIFHNNKPCNAELPPELMLDSWCTPNSVFFIRHHHPVPVVDPETYRLSIDGPGVIKPVRLTLDDLKTRFLKREVVTTIQCGGNRRSELDKVNKTSGIPWGIGAISTAKWGGVYLREILTHCGGLSLEGVGWNGLQHIVAYGEDNMEASIPIDKALSPFGDVLLAYEMNGQPLPAEHGFPVRLVAPGVVGVRNVKWVNRICTSKEEAEGPWQRGIAYKGFSPMIKSCEGIDVAQIQSIQEMPVQSMIVSPKDGATSELDDIEVKGFAWSGGGRKIVRVDVSADDGDTWETATLLDGDEQPPAQAWAWTFWEASIPVPAKLRGKQVKICCRATDSSYNTQPERPEPIWNLRGLNCNCWHYVAVKHDD